MQLLSDNKDRLGYYLVGWKKIYSKTQALIESKKSGYDLIWIFNDFVYDKINWTIPIETNLLELYKRRAQQLREKYDYIILYFSGGCDSGNALHAFLDNNIFIDEIVIHEIDVFKKKANDKDNSNENFYSEIEYAANSHLRKIKNLINPKTKITYQDFTKKSLTSLEKEHWLDTSTINFSINISAVLRQLNLTKDEFHLNLFNKDKTCAHILGVDKPLVYNDGRDYFCYFSDAATYHYMTPIEFSDDVDQSTNFTEYFYWTPDMPEIIVKQAQELKKYYESNPHIQYMARASINKHISEYRNIIHPTVYPPYVVEPFQAEKPPIAIYRPMDTWFWETANKTSQENYLNGIRQLGNYMDNKHFIKGQIEYGLYAHRSKMYKL
jgi:hypothetical protein